MVFITAVMAVASVAGLLLLAGAVARAPEGFEDGDGFHKGTPPEDEEDAL